MRWILWLAIFSIVQDVRAEEPSTFPDDMSLEEMINYALRNSPLSEETEARIELAKLEVVRTRLLNRLMPSVTFYCVSSIGRSSVVENMELWQEDTARLRWNLSLSWDTDRILSFSDHKKRKLQLYQAILERNKLEERIIREISELYFALENLNKREEICEFRVGAKRQLVEYKKELYNAQKITLDELLDSKIDLYEAERILLEINHEKFLAEQRLIHLIGL